MFLLNYVILFACIGIASGYSNCNLKGHYTDPNSRSSLHDYNMYHMCRDCPRGTYSSDGSVRECTPCPEGYTTFRTGSYDVSACTRCEPGHVEVNGTCEPCPIGTFLLVDTTHQKIICKPCYDYGDIKLVTTARNASTSSDDCGCPPGYRDLGPYSSGCKPCGYGYYKGEHGPECTECPPSYTTRTDNSTKLDDCVCSAGTYMDQTINYCVNCGLGYYSSKDATNCIECPPDRTTLEETSDSIDNCVCKVGYFYNTVTDECVQCPGDTFTSAPDSLICSHCPRGQTASADHSRCEPIPNDH